MQLRYSLRVCPGLAVRMIPLDEVPTLPVPPCLRHCLPMLTDPSGP
ncbi:hypothetical protein ACFYST_20005 [Kitasatospora sp. NPDC004614]